MASRNVLTGLVGIFCNQSSNVGKSVGHRLVTHEETIQAVVSFYLILPHHDASHITNFCETSTTMISPDQQSNAIFILRLQFMYREHNTGHPVSRKQCLASVLYFPDLCSCVSCSVIRLLATEVRGWREAATLRTLVASVHDNSHTGYGRPRDLWGYDSSNT